MSHSMIDLEDVLKCNPPDRQHGPADLVIQLGDHQWRVHSKLFIKASKYFAKRCVNNETRRFWPKLRSHCDHLLHSGDPSPKTDMTVVLEGDDPLDVARFIQYMYLSGSYSYDLDGEMTVNRRFATLCCNFTGTEDFESTLQPKLKQLMPVNNPDPRKAGQDQDDFELTTDIAMVRISRKYSTGHLEWIARSIILARLDKNIDQRPYFAKTYTRIYRDMNSDFEESDYFLQRMVEVLIKFMLAGFKIAVNPDYYAVDKAYFLQPQFYQEISDWIKEGGTFAVRLAKMMGGLLETMVREVLQKPEWPLRFLKGKDIIKMHMEMYPEWKPDAKMFTRIWLGSSDAPKSKTPLPAQDLEDSIVKLSGTLERLIS